MTPCRLLVVAPIGDFANAVTASLPPSSAEVVWHPADDGGIFVAVLHDGLWDAVVFWGDPRAYGDGRALEMLRATVPDLPYVIVIGDTSSETTVWGLQQGACALLHQADLGRLQGIVDDLRHDRDRKRHLGDISAVASQHSERYRGLLELSPEPLLVHRRGLFIFANAALARLLGAKAPEELDGRNLFEFLHPDDRVEAVQRAQRVWSSAQLPPAEWRVYRLDGSICHVETSAWPIVYEDEPANLLLCRDITERKLAEAARQSLLSQEQAARLAADTARERLSFLAEAGSILSAELDHEATLENLARVLVPRLADWCVVDEVGIDGQGGFTTFIHAPASSAAFIREIRSRFPVTLDSAHLVSRVYRSGKSELVADLQAADIRLPDGSPFKDTQEVGLKSFLSVPLAAGGQVLGVITVGAGKNRRPYESADISLVEEIAGKAALALSNARLYGALQEADHRKEEFLGLLGHELRNPLAGIRNAVTLLRRRADQADQVARWVDVIDRQQTLLSRLVDDLLDVSRINSGKIHLILQPIDLTTIVRDGVDAAMHSHDMTTIQLQQHLADEPVVVAGDAVRLAQIVSNLLDNAWKYNVPNGGITVSLTSDGQSADLAIADTGVGIDAQALATIFEPFVQLSVGDRTKAGLGLGLTLVKRLTEMHGGTIRAESPGPGQGSVFRLQLPLISPASP